jgi:hypothetical protein
VDILLLLMSDNIAKMPVIPNKFAAYCADLEDGRAAYSYIWSSS